MEHPGGDYADVIGRLLIRVCEIHERVLTGGGGGLEGIRDEGILHAAVARPFASFGGVELYPTDFDKAAAIFHSLIKSHPFIDGNKRTALASAIYFLRDYAYEDVGIEIWMFDDRMEIRSPGQLVEPVTLERLRRRERIHASRNPRIVRVLADWGYMREQGEGVPRMFEVMEREGLYPPEFGLEADVIFTVVLRNTPVYSPETFRWFKQFEHLDLSGNQRRLLAYAREHGGTFTSRAYQKLVGVDIYAASRDIKDLIRKGIVRLPKKGGRVYEVNEPGTSAPSVVEPMEPEIETLLKTQGFVTNEDLRHLLGLSRMQATWKLRKWIEADLLRLEGRGRGARYRPAMHLSNEENA